jgi:hypothetical protein
MLINGLSVPDELHFHNKKPWEIPMQDTMDVWSFGAWQEGFTSLDLICGVLGIPSPKGAMRGEEVPAAFWQGRLERLPIFPSFDLFYLNEIRQPFFSNSLRVRMVLSFFFFLTHVAGSSPVPVTPVPVTFAGTGESSLILPTDDFNQAFLTALSSVFWAAADLLGFCSLALLTLPTNSGDNSLIIRSSLTRLLYSYP